MQVKLHNTLSDEKDVFTTYTDSDVRMYVCGITPYDESHIGHARTYITFDVLYRLLQSLGYDVQYARNITDIDDKIIQKARDVYDDPSAYAQIADHYIEAFHRDMARLGCQIPTYEPRVTHSILSIIGAIQELIDHGCAYTVNGNVYFDVTSYPSYGSLSRQDLQEMRSGARVQEHGEKRNAADFALWKHDATKAAFDSPWGPGRPGWHIECSVLAHECLGTPIDIHGGGMDLIFPHHENEIAQTACWKHYPMARFFVHNAFVQIHQEKMAKSEGNFYTVNELCQQHDPTVIRFMMLRHHYRTPLNFSQEELADAQKAYKKLVRAFADAEQLVHITPKTERIKQLYQQLCDDLNVPGMIGLIFKHLDALRQDSYEAAAVKTILINICGLSLREVQEPQQEIPEDVQAMMYQRDEARKQRDWQKADELRYYIEQRGYAVQDRPLSELDETS